MGFDSNYVPDNGDDFIDVEEAGTVCPQCASDNLEYKGETYDDDHHMGSGWRCDECGLSFTDEEIRDGTW